MVTPIHTFLSGKWSVLVLRIVVLLSVFAAYAGTTYASSASGSAEPASKEENSQDKVVYLSFDDGPGNHTREVLDILRKEQVLATFFVLGEQAERYPEMIRGVVEDGHALGNHTFNHNYEQLYSDFKVFWKQIKQTEEVVNRITGFRPNLVRAPGGTYGHFDQSYFDLMKLGGYTVMDWNVDSGDSKRKGVPAKEILRNATKLPAGARSVIVLMHDGGAHAETVKALPGIIKYYRDQGFRFDTMKASDQPVQFRINSNGKYKSRKAPGTKWIAEHVLENSNLWLAGKELKVEIGFTAATLKQGEFRVEDQRIMVPLRTFMKKFGGSARWNADTRTATAVWKDRIIHADSISGDLITKSANQIHDRTTEAVVQSQGGTTWVPLRDLMEHMGTDIDSLKANEKEWIVKASVPLASATSMYMDKLI
ncbi:MAG TPA: polysaccharide deacetylase [Paenibacillus sp.]|uniref:polysaccharide deacetylase n=1 Tax=Paenibacillus TaxID=44249 RepID=UPI000BA12E24|nr:MULTISPECIES: polysaccharide deacetylase [Paenibacillus]OZQ62651.1 polysaccharide deacetylase [Paenibacillus taichungensis]HBU81528.1 polysaccharide deacetylase [Paenibacillus sp.]